jgi:hypothetical protein
MNLMKEYLLSERKKIVINRYNKYKENFEKFKEIYDK